MSSKSEEWKDITGYEGLYQVSTLGNVRSYDKIVGCRGGKTRLVKGKILAPTRSGNGYVKVMLTKNKTRRNRNVHRLVAEAFIPNPDGFTDINSHRHISDCCKGKAKTCYGFKWEYC